MEKLKPCPFCGEEVVLLQHDAPCWVECPSCGCSVDVSESPELAIWIWNARLNEAALEARVKELEAELAAAAAELTDNMRVNERNAKSIEMANQMMKELAKDLATARQSAVQWRTYTGEPETLPDQSRWVMVELSGHKEPVAALCLLHIDSDHAMYWASTDKDWGVSRGDRWAYLPTPPEAPEVKP